MPPPPRNGRKKRTTTMFFGFIFVMSAFLLTFLCTDECSMQLLAKQLRAINYILLSKEIRNNLYGIYTFLFNSTPDSPKTAVGQCGGRRVQMGMYKKCYDAVTLPGGKAKEEDRKMLKGQKSSQCFRYCESRLIAPPAENTFRVQWRRALVNKYEMNIMRVIVALAFPTTAPPLPV